MDMDEDLPKEPIENQTPGADNNFNEPFPITEDSDPKKPGFLPEVLDRTVITAPMFAEFTKHKGLHSIIIDINLLYHAGREAAKAEVQQLIIDILSNFPDRQEGQGVHTLKTRYSQQYVFAMLQEEVINSW
jgi:hypothetical protein